MPRIKSVEDFNKKSSPSRQLEMREFYEDVEKSREDFPKKYGPKLAKSQGISITEGIELARALDLAGKADQVLEMIAHGPPKKRGRPAKSKPSEAPIEVDRNVYAHARIRKDDEYMGIIKDLWHKQTITTTKMNNMMGDLEDNKYDKLEKALSEYTKAKPVLHIPTRSTTPEPVYVPKKRGRPSKPVDTSELKSIINEINEHGKHNPVTIASMPAFPKFPKAKPTKEPRSEIKSLKNNIKNKAKRMISEIEHSDLMKYISQF